jgi:hypothetical protein
MANAQDYLTGLAQLHELTNDEDRRTVWRQGLSALAEIASVRPAPLEGLDPESLVSSARVALLTGLVDDTGFLSKPVAAAALFEIAAALPPGIEKSDLGRRISTALQAGDAATFVAVTRALALGVPRALADPVVEARVALALQLPLGGDSGVDALALALISHAELEETWLTAPSKGSLAARRLAARVLERAACEVARKEGEGNPVGARAMAQPSVRAAWQRLLYDRESLVWRHVATARGVLSAAIPAFVEEIERELAPRNGPGEWRRAATSLAARLGQDTTAGARCRELAAGELGKRDPGIKMAMVYGLARAGEAEPEAADALLNWLVQTGDVEVIEALVELRRQRASSDLGAAAVTAALIRLRGLPPTNDDGVVSLRQELVAALEPDDGRRERTIEELCASALQAFSDGGDLRPRTEAALVAAGRVLAEVEASTDASPEARRRSFRAVGQLERGLLETAVLRHLLAVARPAGKRGAGEPDPLAALLARLDEWICKREEPPLPTSEVPHLTFRLRRLRALLHVLDVERGAGDDAGPARAGRLRAFRLLVRRVQNDPASPLKRITAATLARACDRIARANMGELSDVLVAVLTRVRNHADLRIVADASMVAEVKEVMSAAADLVQLAGPSAQEDGARSFLEPLARLAQALPLAVSPRVEGLRQTLVQLGQALRALDQVSALAALEPDDNGSPLQGLDATVAYAARFFAAARARVGLPGPASGPVVGAAVHALDAAVEAARRGVDADLGGPISDVVEALRADFPAGIGDAVARVLSRLGELPRDRLSDGAPVRPAVADPAPRLRLPAWLPSSRLMGGFYIQRPISSGAAGSVFVAQRAHERHDDAAETYALKVPSYNGQNSRTLNEQEFLTLFREEAGALLTLEPHPNLAGFVTFDAAARPKPILVMELVTGASLERILDRRELSTASAFAILDGIAAGLGAMHAQGLGHLDLKPANVILRQPRGDSDLVGDGHAVPVLVDFGLAGRKIRPGCASPHYGAPEIWDPGMYGSTEPTPADVYGFACLAYEMLVGRPLFAADTLPGLIACHFEHDGHPEGLAAMRATRGLAPLAQILEESLAPNPRARATIAQVRDALRELQPSLRAAAWPLAVAA